MYRKVNIVIILVRAEAFGPEQGNNFRLFCRFSLFWLSRFD